MYFPFALVALLCILFCIGKSVEAFRRKNRNQQSRPYRPYHYQQLTIKVAAGFVVFRRTSNDIQYLLLQTSDAPHYWTPPTGI